MSARTLAYHGIKTVVEREMRKLPDMRQVVLRNNLNSGATQAYPCIELQYASEPDEERPGTAEEFEVGYGFLLLFKYRSDAGPQMKDDRANRWYDQIAAWFRQRNPNEATRLPGVEGCREVRITPLPVLDIQEGTFQLIQGGMKITAYVVASRG